MKLVKKWLLPVLTCLIAAGGLVLPPYLSQARDAGQFGQVHAELLAADAMPIHTLPTLTDRVMLYCEYSTYQIPILSFRDGSYFYDSAQEKAALAQSVQNQLTQAGILPTWFFEEDPFTALEVERILLWNPDGDGARQEPSIFFNFQWSNNDKSHGKLLTVVTDAETSLPIDISIYDTNLSRWLPYDLEPMRERALRYFALMGWEIREVGEPSEVWEGLTYELADSNMRFHLHRQPVFLDIEPDYNWRPGTDTDSGSFAFDG